MTPGEYQKLAERTECDNEKAIINSFYLATDRAVRNARLIHGATGVVKEGGEILSLMTRMVFHGQEIPDIRQRIADEGGDVLWFLALLFNAFDLDMEAVMRGNIAKLRARFPDKYDDSLTKEENRDRQAESQAVNTQVGSHVVSTDSPLVTCHHCRGTGEVDCEWAIGVMTTCPTCSGYGRRRNG